VIREGCPRIPDESLMIPADDLDGSGTDAFPMNELDEGVAPISIRI
jgi:hypothetical protein